jgi:hypothetical protein
MVVVAVLVTVLVTVGVAVLVIRDAGDDVTVFVAGEVGVAECDMVLVVDTEVVGHNADRGGGRLLLKEA